MPVVINEIVIRSVVENSTAQPGNTAAAAQNPGQLDAERLVKQAVEQVLEILQDKKMR